MFIYIFKNEGHGPESFTAFPSDLDADQFWNSEDGRRFKADVESIYLGHMVLTDVARAGHVLEEGGLGPKLASAFLGPAKHHDERQVEELKKLWKTFDGQGLVISIIQATLRFAHRSNI